MIKITHLTSAHPRYDTRIFYKECSSLAMVNNYQVSLIVADGLGEENINNINIYDVGKDSGRLRRVFKTTQRIYKKALALDSDIYHFHDPELIPVGLKLKKLGKKVIFDSHEDVPKQILSKHYLNPTIRTIISNAFKVYENYAARQFDYIIAATPYIRDLFLPINTSCNDINNFPIVAELNNNTSWESRQDQVCYIGAITTVRGIKEVVKAMELCTNVQLNLAGKFSQEEVRTEVESYTGWSKVNFLGFVDRREVADIMSRSRVGLVTLHPIINYLDSLPIKMFEYMTAGLPVVSSDFPLWKDIVQKSGCGLCVDPLNTTAIAEAINYILTHPEEAKKMGENGKRAVLEHYNWQNEEQKLLAIYHKLTQ